MPAYPKKSRKNTLKKKEEKENGEENGEKTEKKRRKETKRGKKTPIWSRSHGFYVRSECLPSLSVLGLDSLSYLIIFILLSL